MSKSIWLENNNLRKIYVKDHNLFIENLIEDTTNSYEIFMINLKNLRNLSNKWVSVDSLNEFLSKPEARLKRNGLEIKVKSEYNIGFKLRFDIVGEDYNKLMNYINS